MKNLSRTLICIACMCMLTGCGDKEQAKEVKPETTSTTKAISTTAESTTISEITTEEQTDTKTTAKSKMTTQKSSVTTTKAHTTTTTTKKAVVTTTKPVTTALPTTTGESSYSKACRLKEAAIQYAQSLGMTYVPSWKAEERNYVQYTCTVDDTVSYEQGFKWLKDDIDKNFGWGSTAFNVIMYTETWDGQPYYVVDMMY